MSNDLLLRDEEREAIRGGVRTFIRARRRRNRGIAIGVAAVLVAGATVGVSVVVTAPTQVQNRVVSCYTQASTSAKFVQSNNAEGASPAEVVRNGLEACATLWQVGALKDPDVGAGGSAHPVVPKLTACTSDNGTVSIFPGGPGTPHSTRPDDDSADARFCSGLDLGPASTS